MAMPGNNAYRRMTGVLRFNGRSAVLETSEGELIYLIGDADFAALDGNRVVVEGQLSSADRITLTWLGSAEG